MCVNYDPIPVHGMRYPIRIIVMPPRVRISPTTPQRLHERLVIAIIPTFLNKEDSGPAPFRLFGQIRDRQVIQGELLEVTFELIRQQVGILDYQVVRHCQQLSDERTTARQHEDVIVEYAKRHVNGRPRRRTTCRP